MDVIYTICHSQVPIYIYHIIHAAPTCSWSPFNPARIGGSMTKSRTAPSRATETAKEGSFRAGAICTATTSMPVGEGGGLVLVVGGVCLARVFCVGRGVVVSEWCLRVFGDGGRWGGVCNMCMYVHTRIYFFKYSYTIIFHVYVCTYKHICTYTHKYR